MSLDIGYDTFENDCKRIIGNILQKKYSFEDVSLKYQDISDNCHTLFYSKNTWLLKVSMIDNFPYIGASIGHFSLNESFARPSILNSCLNINSKASNEYFNSFKKKHGIETYEDELKYAILYEEAFYRPILTGEFTFEDYKEFESSLKDEDEESRGDCK